MTACFAKTFSISVIENDTTGIVSSSSTVVTEIVDVNIINLNPRSRKTLAFPFMRTSRSPGTETTTAFGAFVLVFVQIVISSLLDRRK
jgi:hypothetical protein